MLNFAEQTGSGVFIVVWSLLVLQCPMKYSIFVTCFCPPASVAMAAGGITHHPRVVLYDMLSSIERCSIGECIPMKSIASQLSRSRVAVLALLLPLTTLLSPSDGLLPNQIHYTCSSLSNLPPHLPDTTLFMAPDSNDNDDKFSFGQRIESTKCVVVGALSGGIAVTPFTALHDIFLGPEMNNGVAQWEFDTDMGSLEAALFAIVYRYCIRTDNNPMLNQGVIGAFVFVRTLSRIRVPSYCTAAPLDCGSPLGYFDWSMIQQGVFSGIESVALFGGAAFAMDYCFRKGYISKFPG